MVAAAHGRRRPAKAPPRKNPVQDWAFIEGPPAPRRKKNGVGYVREVGAMIGTISAAVEDVVRAEFLHGRPADDGLEVPNQSAAFVAGGFNFSGCSLDRFPLQHFKAAHIGVRKEAAQRQPTAPPPVVNSAKQRADATVQTQMLDGLSPSVRTRVEAVLHPGLEPTLPPRPEERDAGSPTYASQFERRYSGEIVSRMVGGRGLLKVSPSVDDVLGAGAGDAARYIGFEEAFGGETRVREGQVVSFRLEAYSATPTPPLSPSSSATSEASQHSVFYAGVRSPGDGQPSNAPIQWTDHPDDGGVISATSNARMWTVQDPAAARRGSRASGRSSRASDGLHLFSEMGESSEDDWDAMDRFVPRRRGTQLSRGSGRSSMRSRPTLGSVCVTPPTMPAPRKSTVLLGEGLDSENVRGETLRPPAGYGIDGSAEAQTLDSVVEREVKPLRMYLAHRNLDPFAQQNHQNLVGGTSPTAGPSDALLIPDAVADATPATITDDAVSLGEDSAFEMSQLIMEPPWQVAVPAGGGERQILDRYNQQIAEHAEVAKKRSFSIYSPEWYDKIIGEDAIATESQGSDDNAVKFDRTKKSWASSRRSLALMRLLGAGVRRRKSTAWNLRGRSMGTLHDSDAAGEEALPNVARPSQAKPSKSFRKQTSMHTPHAAPSSKQRTLPQTLSARRQHPSARLLARAPASCRVPSASMFSPAASGRGIAGFAAKEVKATNSFFQQNVVRPPVTQSPPESFLVAAVKPPNATSSLNMTADLSAVSARAERVRMDEAVVAPPTLEGLAADADSVPWASASAPRVTRYRAVDIVAEKIMPYRKRSPAPPSSDDEPAAAAPAVSAKRSRSRVSLAGKLHGRMSQTRVDSQSSFRRLGHAVMMSSNRRRRRRLSLHTDEGLQFFVDNVQPTLRAERFQSGAGTVVSMDNVAPPPALPPLSLYDLIVARLTMPDDERKELLNELQHYSLEKTGVAMVTPKDQRQSAAAEKADKERREVEQRICHIYAENHPLDRLQTPDLMVLPRELQTRVDSACAVWSPAAVDNPLHEPAKPADACQSLGDVVTLFKRKGMDRKCLHDLLAKHRLPEHDDSDDSDYGVIKDIDRRTRRVRTPEDLCKRPPWNAFSRCPAPPPPTFLSSPPAVPTDAPELPSNNNHRSGGHDVSAGSLEPSPPQGARRSRRPPHTART